MSHFRRHRAQYVSVGTMWNAAVAVGLLAALLLPALVQPN